LPHLWLRGSLAGLTLALAFSVLLNVLVLGTLVWPAWLESRLKFACATTALGLWVAALWETRGELRRLAARKEAAQKETAAATDLPLVTDLPTPDDHLLQAAQTSYLQGDWLAAERSLRKAIRRDRDDFEARFWLVSVLRNAGRLRQAERLLRRVESRDAARAWRHEVTDERRRLTELLAPPTVADDGPTLLPIRPDLHAAATPAHRAA
jgi:tetratricopeptide (TPR) repeat protein